MSDAPPTPGDHPFRTHSCGELRAQNEGERVRLSGWVRSNRDLGRLLFLDLFDGEGTTQVVVTDPEMRDSLCNLEPGALLTVTGRVQRRIAGGENPSLATGEVEVSLGSFRRGPGSVRSGSETSTPGVADFVARALGAMRSLLDEERFLEVVGEDTVWSTGLRPGHRDRCYRVRGTRAKPILEIAATFVTGRETRDLVERLLRAGAARIADPLSDPPFPRLTWDAPHTCEDGALVWRIGPPAAERPRTGFPVDPCLYLLAMPTDARGEEPGLDLPLSESEVSAWELWRGDSCVGVGAIPCHDPAHMAGLSDASSSAPPTVRARVQESHRALLEGEPPSTRFTLSVADALGLGDPPVPSPPRAETTLSMASQESALVSAALGAVTLDPVEVDRRARRAGRRDLETASAVIASLGGVPLASLEDAATLEDAPTVERLLRDSSIAAVHWRRLLDLFPPLSRKVLRLPPDELYQWLWSILGNDFVRDLLADHASYRIVREAISSGLVRDHHQLVYFDKAALLDLDETLTRYLEMGVARTHLVIALRRVLAEHPAAFSTLLTALVTSPEATRRVVAARLANGGDGNLLLAAARSGFCGPATLSLYLNAAKEDQLRRLGDCMSRLTAVLYPNRAVDAYALAREVTWSLRDLGFDPETIERAVGDPHQLLADLLYYLYRPTNLSVRRIHDLLGELRDATGDFETAGLRPGGEHWSEADECFVFTSTHEEVGQIRLYPSKNIASFFSKASAGICTSRDVELFLREDHFHLNVVGSEEPFVVGNVQLHVLDDGADRVLLIRAVNASVSWLDSAHATVLVRAVMVAAVELALHSGITRVDLGEGMYLWHLDSARPEIRALLDAYEDWLPLKPLAAPLLLFRFGGSDRILQRSYRLWPLPPGLVRVVGCS